MTPYWKKVPTMRKGPKIILIAAAVLIGIGALLMGASWASAGFDLSRLSTVDYAWEKTEQVLEGETTKPHNRIVVDSSMENVRFERAKGDAIELEYWTGNAQDVEVTDEAGTLTIKVTVKPMNGIMLDLSPVEEYGEDVGTTVVRVPESFTGAIEVDADASEVLVEELNGLNELFASSDNGSIVLNDVSAAKIEARNTNGDSMLSAVEAEQLTVTNKNGDTSLGGVKAQNAKVVSKNGDITLANLTMDAAFTCESKNGDILAQELDIAENTFENANGDIYLSYRGTGDEYRIDACSKLGDVTAPHGNFDAERIVRAENDCGDITVEFEQ